MTEPVLKLSGLTKSFGALKASDGVNLELQAGQIHALIGPNGAGKSTLIGQIAGFTAPDAGTIHLAGQDVTHKSPEARVRLGLGRSFQVSNLMLPWSARRNVMLAVQGRQGRSFGFLRSVRRDADLRNAADAALDQVGLSDRADIAVASLSHGERRQLELACALALQPKLLVLDEPMAGLGQQGTAAITDFLAGLKAQMPILLVEHDMDAVFALADTISVLVYGRVIASGPPDAIRTSKQVQTAYLGEGDDAA